MSYTKLKIWDFDGTLIDTPLPENGKPLWLEATGKPWPHEGWWSKVESLDMDIFEMPTIPCVIEDYEKHTGQDGVFMVMLTGRRAKRPLEEATRKILDSKGLTFDRYYHNNGAATEDNKMWRIEELLSEFPTIKSLEMWDDRDEHIPIFQKWGDQLVADGILDEFKINHVLGEHHGMTP